jgi:hypothetical protein
MLGRFDEIYELFVFIGAKNTVTILGWFHMGHLAG